MENGSETPEGARYVIGGSNGAGKTTFAREFLPDYAHCLRFINPDLIAAGLSPFDPLAAAAEAAKVVLREVQRAIGAGDSFAFESTLTVQGSPALQGVGELNPCPRGS